jgi:hypothetical protein
MSETLMTIQAGESKANKLARIFLSEETYPVAQLAIALKVMSVEDLQSFHPESIRMELMEALAIRYIPSNRWDTFMSALTIFSTDVFYNDIFSFNELCNLMSQSPTSPDDFEPADSYEMAWAVHQARIIDPMDGDTDLNFSEEVKMYIGAMLDMEGYIRPPHVLRDAIMPETSALNTESWVDDTEFMPAILDTASTLITDLETTLKELDTELKAQLQEIANIA